MGRNSVAVIIQLPSPIAGVLDGVSLPRLFNHASHLLDQPLMATVRVDRRVRGDLGAIDRDSSELRQTGTTSDQQNLREQPPERVLTLGTEPGDRAVVRHVLGAQHTERHIGRAQAFNLARGTDTPTIRIDQQAQQHPRVIAGCAHPTTAPTPIELAGIERLDGLQQKPNEMIVRQSLPHVRRQKKHLVTQHWTISLGHAQFSQAVITSTRILQQAP